MRRDHDTIGNTLVNSSRMKFSVATGIVEEDLRREFPTWMLRGTVHLHDYEPGSEFLSMPLTNFPPTRDEKEIAAQFGVAFGGPSH
jgi:hypothetical protein